MAATISLPSSVAAQSRTEARLRLWPEWLTVFLYTSLVAFAIPFHEPWADEAQAWQMARALSVHDLFFHALRYEGTPALWHLFLRGLIQLHVSYAQMHWIVGLIAVCGMSLLIFFAPFPRWVRLTLPFTFFFAFQYAIVARSYILAPLLAFAVAIFWNRNTVVLAILLGLLANTSLHGFALAASLASYISSRRAADSTNPFIRVSRSPSCLRSSRLRSTPLFLRRPTSTLTTSPYVCRWATVSRPLLSSPLPISCAHSRIPGNWQHPL